MSRALSAGRARVNALLMRSGERKGIYKDKEGAASNALKTGTVLPVFSLGQIDNGQFAAAGSLITGLVTGKVIAPEEPWIRGYLGLPAKPPPPAGAADTW